MSWNHLRVVAPRMVRTTSSCTPGKSARVMTARTPGSASAFEVSMPRMCACACGLRFSRPNSVPGSCVSAP